MPPARNWFDQGGQAYARFRPAYPPELASILASLTPEHRLAVDVGCGTGQLTRLLARHYDHVVGIDPSADQIANALADTRIDYRCAPAERIPLAAGSTSLVTAAQAAHWFDLPAFYREVRRVARPGALLALVGYGVLQLDPALDERFQAFYRDEIGPYWPVERKLVDTGYATIDFPFPEREPPPLDIRCLWSLPQFLGYLSTWSAVRRAREAGQDQLLTAFWNDMAGAWGDPGLERPVRWPIHMRIGRL
jgi:SAM-dependent methyltransferase